MSRNEKDVADLIEGFLANRIKGEVLRIKNNIVAFSKYLPGRPLVMLNSHLDTVKPSEGYTSDPFTPQRCDGKIIGLGSNDAGASVIALIVTYLALYVSDSLPFNLMLALSAEEEVGGENGMRHLLPVLKERGMLPDMAIVGEPTGMRGAIAERGLVVLDCVTRGVAGHAARNEGENAIYRAIEDINRLRTFRFPEESEILGPVKISITQIEAGSQHNVVPDTCKWVVDIRTTDAYSNQQTVDILRSVVSVHTELTPRSTRVQASVITEDSPLVKVCRKLGIETFVSPTTSDMSLMYGIPSLKIGPGESSRSHTADEYVLISEIEEGIEIYKKLLLNLLK